MFNLMLNITEQIQPLYNIKTNNMWGEIKIKSV